jgi:hypothetical protein
MTTFRAVEDSSRDFATLYLLAALGPRLLAPPDGGPLALDAPAWVAASVLGLGLLADTLRALGMMARWAKGALSGMGHRVPVPGRGLAVWALDVVSREPPIDSEQARESLANLCGYRLHGDGYRIVSVTPSVRHWRAGVWVTIARPSSFTRRWECRYVRWVDDPHELWLLRSALRPTAGDRPPHPQREGPRPIPLDGINGDEIDELLGDAEPRRGDGLGRSGASKG